MGAAARAGLIAPDDTTFAYLEGRPSAPRGKAWEQALDYWRSLVTDPDAEFEKRVTLRAESIEPFVTWGVTPAQSVPVGGRVPDPVSLPHRAGLHGTATEYRNRRQRTRPRVHRLMHQLPSRRPTRRSGRGPRPEGSPHAEGDGRARLRSHQSPGGEGRSRQGVPRRGLRVARRRLFDVPRHEPGHPDARRTLRVHIQPKL